MAANFSGVDSNVQVDSTDKLYLTGRPDLSLDYINILKLDLVTDNTLWFKKYTHTTFVGGTGLGSGSHCHLSLDELTLYQFGVTRETSVTNDHLFLLLIDTSNGSLSKSFKLPGGGND